MPDPPEDPPSKRAKLEPSGSDAPSEEDAAVRLKDEEPRVCVVCLGILQDLCDSSQAVKVCAFIITYTVTTAVSDCTVAEMSCVVL